MERSCVQALALGLPAVAFTEHVDHTAWHVNIEALRDGDHLATLASPGGLITPPPFDALGFLEAIQRCREQFPGVRVLSGLELGEPHWHTEAVAAVLAAGEFDRVLGSLHCLPARGGFTEPPGLYADRVAADVVRDYLAEVVRLVNGSDTFDVLAHIDYPIRYWPEPQAGPFRLAMFEEEFRHVLRVTAEQGKALEINTRLPLDSTILRWWHEAGGQAVSFGSDAHTPAAVARGFRAAADMAEAQGFRPATDAFGFWARAD